MLKTMAEVESAFLKYNRLHENDEISTKEYVRKLKYIYDCSKYIKHYDKKYNVEENIIEKNKTKRKK